MLGILTLDLGKRSAYACGCKEKQYCTSERRLDGKIAVITGGNTGIGKETAAFFCQRGAQVVITARDRKKGEEAIKDMKKKLNPNENPGKLMVALLDLSSFASVRHCAEELLKILPRIDILVNNAGVMTPPFGLTEDGFELQFGTNHLGHFLFTLLLLPRILSSTPARIVNLTSCANDFYKDMALDEINNSEKYYGIHAYFRSKAANILFTRELAKRLRGKGVNTYAVHPGYVTTPLYRHSGKTFLPGLPWLVDHIFPFLFKDVWEGAQTTIHCAICEGVDQETGLFYEDCHVSSPNDICKDEQLCQELWDKSVEWVKLDLEAFDPFSPDKIVVQTEQPGPHPYNGLTTVHL